MNTALKNKLQNRRYYLRERLKGRFAINTADRSIKIPFASVDAIPIGDRYYVRQLLKMGYNCQLELF